MDKLRVHHSKQVKAWLLNNADLKHRLRSRVQVRTKEQLRAATQAPMQEIKAQPERVMAYFRDPHVQYASGFNG